MRSVLCLLALALTLAAQNPNSAVFPAGTAADSDLFVATNNGSTTLNTTVNNSVTSIVLTSGTGFVAPVIIAIESEIIHCTTLTTNTLSGCTRGTEGTSAASHTSGVAVTNIITAWHHNQMAAEVKAVEAQLSNFTGLRQANGNSADTLADRATFAAIAAPSTPASGKGVVYVDSASKNVAVKDDAGVVKHGVQTDTGTANNYISAIADNGAITKSRPSCSTLSDAGAGCSSSATTSPITWVQSQSARGNPVTTLAYPTNVTSGHVLVVGAGWNAGANTNPTISDTLTTSWTRVTGTTCTGGAASNVTFWTGTASSSGADTVTIGFPSGAGFTGIYVTEWTGLTETVDASTCSTVANPAGYFTISITPATAGDVVLSLADGQTSLAGSSCIASLFATSTTTGNDSGVLCFSIQNTAGKILNQATNTSTAGGAVAMLALKHP